MKKFVFIDGQNIYLAIKNAGWELDWKKFFIYLKEKYQVEEVLLFLGYIEENQKLYHYLTISGFQIIFKEVIRGTRGIKGNVDMEMAVEVMRSYKKWDRAIFVTNDGDFSALISYLKEKNKFEILLSPDIKTCARLLKKTAAQKIICLSELQEKIGVQKKSHPLQTKQ